MSNDRCKAGNTVKKNIFKFREVNISNKAVKSIAFVFARYGNRNILHRQVLTVVFMTKNTMARGNNPLKRVAVT